MFTNHHTNRKLHHLKLLLKAMFEELYRLSRRASITLEIDQAVVVMI